VGLRTGLDTFGRGGMKMLRQNSQREKDEEKEI
jgi:hypothetical protein